MKNPARHECPGNACGFARCRGTSWCFDTDRMRWWSLADGQEHELKLFEYDGKTAYGYTSGGRNFVFPQRAIKELQASRMLEEILARAEDPDPVK